MAAPHRWLSAMLACVLLLGGCGAGAEAGAAVQAPVQDPAQAPAQESALPGTTGGGFTAPAFAGSTFHPEAAAGEDGVLLDLSDASNGIVAVSATADAKLKFQVRYGETDYNYNLPADGTPQCFVLQSGSGSYTFRVMKNTTGDKYAALYTQTAEVTLADELAPYLRPNQMVDYTADSACVAKAAALAAEAADEAGAVANIYADICDNVTYDAEKAKTVQAGYLPNPDDTLATGKGICFDYAALAAAMLRSQGIPTKVITGYVAPGDVYHAWNMIWLEETGWVTVTIQAPADAWNRIDLTFAAGADTAYTGDGTSYTDRYTY